MERRKMTLQEAFWALGELSYLTPQQSEAVRVVCEAVELHVIQNWAWTCPVSLCRHEGNAGCQCDDCCRRTPPLFDNFELSEDATESVYRLDEGTYVDIHATDDGYDYSIYNSAYALKDGGRLTEPALDIASAARAALALQDLNVNIIRDVADQTQFRENVALTELLHKRLPYDGEHSQGNYCLQIFLWGDRSTIWVSILNFVPEEVARKVGADLRQEFPDLWLRVILTPQPEN